MELKLGHTLEDAVTGFKGIAIQLRETLSGNVQFAIQPKNKEGENELPDAHFIDIHMLNFVDEGVAARVTKPTQQLIPLGSKIRDKATLLEGIATARDTFINGCIFYELMPKKKSTMFDANPDAQWIDDTRLEVVLDAVVMGFAPETVEVGVKKRGPGGPSMKMEREQVRR